MSCNYQENIFTNSKNLFNFLKEKPYRKGGREVLYCLKYESAKACKSLDTSLGKSVLNATSKE